MPSRTTIYLLLAIYGALAVPRACAAAENGVAVVTVSGVPAYQQAVNAIRARLPNIQLFEAREEERLKSEYNKHRPSLAIAIGPEAAGAIDRTVHAGIPVIHALLYEAEVDQGLKSTTTVVLDIPPAALVEQLKRYFPGKMRIGFLRGPSQTDAYVRSFEQAARSAGVTLVVISCREARDLVATFLQFEGKADLIWCPPNAQLYTTATVKPLLIASITNRLPIIGFSEQFVKAGALFGGGPDLADAGEQTASAAERVLRHETVPERLCVRKFHYLYNQHIARLLGVKGSDVLDSPELTVLR